jgi:hypothetical protein
MDNKNKIGFALVILGVGALGYYWINKTKPTITATQQAKLQNELNNITAYGGKADETVKITPVSVAPVPVDRELFPANMTKQEISDLGKAVNDVCPSCKNLDYNTTIANSIISNLKGNDLVNMKTGLEGFVAPTNLNA